MNKNIVYKIVIVLLISGVYHSVLLGQRNPRGMVFQNKVDSLFFVFNPQTLSIDNDFPKKFRSDYLLDKLKSDDEHFQYKSLFLLGYKNDRETIEAIASFLSHKNERLIKCAIHTLEKIHYRESSNHLGTALIENTYTDKHIKGYIINALINLTFVEGLDFLNEFLEQKNTEKLNIFFKTLAVEGISTIAKYNEGEIKRFELIKEFLTLTHKKQWALNKIMLEKESSLWLPELKELGNDVDMLLVRKELGDTSFNESERLILENVRKRKTCE